MEQLGVRTETHVEGFEPWPESTGEAGGDEKENVEGVTESEAKRRVHRRVDGGGRYQRLNKSLLYDPGSDLSGGQYRSGHRRLG